MTESSSLEAAAARVSAPGVALAVRAQGREALVVNGFRQVFDDSGPLATPLPMTADTWIDLASVTKVTATTPAIMALHEAGSVDLGACLDAYLPAARGRPAGAATLTDLLLHRAGLWEWWPLYAHASAPAEAVELALRLPLRYPPGSGRHYSDLGFILLGAVVEAVTGLPLDRAVAELVLRPYGLSARYARPPAGAPVLAGRRGDDIEERMVATGEPYPVERVAYDGWRPYVITGEVADGNAFHAFGGVAGHAGLFGTVSDLLDLGGHWLRSASAPLFFAPGPDPEQALGFRRWTSRVDDCVADAIGHPGFTGSTLAVVPLHGASVVLATNRLHTEGTPPPHDAAWRIALDAAHLHLHRER